MEKPYLKRNISEDIRDWDENKTGPLLVYGLKGVGKAFICREYASAYDAYMYYEPENSLVKNGCTEEPDEHIAAHFGLSREALYSSFMILNETEQAEKFFDKLFAIAMDKGCKWIFISDHDYIKNGAANKIQMFPLQFDEFLLNLGINEWYVDSVRENLLHKTKLPDIMHNNLLSTFEEYIWTGGMPEVVNEYVKEYRLGIRSKQNDARQKIYYTVNGVEDESTRNKCFQILDTMDDQLSRSNRKFMFSRIRNGVTLQMYSKALEELIDRGLVLRINEVSDERKFKLFHPEFSFNQPESFDEITDVEFALREENYILQSFKQQGLEVSFWESGNKAELPFVIEMGDGRKVPVDYCGEMRKTSKSMLSYKNRNGAVKSLILTDSNFVDDTDSAIVPVYAAFCIKKLMEVLF